MRSKLRDLAAAEHGEATAATRRAETRVAVEETLLEDTLDEAEDTLTGITSVYALDQVAGLVECQRLAITNAQQAHSTAAEVANLAEARLRARIRQLKTAERVVELGKEERAVREAKAEQLANDDLVHARLK
ncbi:hypothetical protein BH11MYX1_BH11MYX1_56280 [soil metagenome]